MTTLLILILVVLILVGIAYLIGHTHGRNAAPQVIVTGTTSNTGTGSTAPAGGTQPGDAPQIKAE